MTYRFHENLLGRKRRLAQRPVDEGVDAVGPVDEIGRAVLFGVFRRVVGDEPLVDLDDLGGFLASHAGFVVAWGDRSDGGGQRERQAGESGDGESREAHVVCDMMSEPGVNGEACW